jgi:hypothetical protein
MIPARLGWRYNMGLGSDYCHMYSKYGSIGACVEGNGSDLQEYTVSVQNQLGHLVYEQVDRVAPETAQWSSTITQQYKLF